MTAPQFTEPPRDIDPSGAEMGRGTQIDNFIAETLRGNEDSEPTRW